MILYLVGVVSIYCFGLIVRRIIFFNNTAAISATEKFGLDFGLGSGCLALLLFNLSFFGIRLTRPLMLGIAASVIVITFVIKIFDFTRSQNQPKMPRPKMKISNIILIAVILLSVSVIFFKNTYYPMYEWASRSCFGLKAKILYNTETIYDKALLDKEFVMEHPEYPLSVPILEAWMHKIMNTGDDRFGKSYLPFMAIAFLCLIYAVQRKFCGPTHSLIFTVLYSLIYVFIYRFACAEADAPLAFYYFTAGAYLFLWICFEKYPYLIIAALFTAFAIFTKNEATSFFIIMSSCLCLKLVLDCRKSFMGRAAALITYMKLAVIVLIPWLIYRFKLPTTDILVNEKTFFSPDALNTLVANFGRTGEILNNFVFDIVLRVRKWGLFWVVFFVIQLLTFKDIFKKPIIYLAYMVWATILLYYLMFIIVYLEPAHMLIGMDRFALQVSGLALLLISLLARQKI